jgi:hypothetical protein
MRRLKISETAWIILLGIALYLLWVLIYFSDKL